ncbi:MAG: GDP-mannose 4,6-dehydratase [Ferruginibacter sp.]
MKILITGISGFVARHFLEFLSTTGEQYEVAGIYFRHTPTFNVNQFSNVTGNLYKTDLRDKDALTKILLDFDPGYILHLASQSSVAYSWVHPAESIIENNSIFLNLMEQVRLLNLKCRILSVGSSEEYGNVNEAPLPLREEQCTTPVSPYGVSKVFQQILGHIYSLNYDLDIVRTRSFNHLGPYQTDNFVISSFTKQLATQLVKGEKKVKLTVGDMGVIRDFTDVRDVVKAYYLLLLNGKRGSIYNVCSHKGFILKDIIAMLEEISGTCIELEIKESRFRPSENKKIIGSYDKIKNELGWQPLIPMKQSLTDLLHYWMEEIKSRQLSA